jgi:hypothetical protein
VVTHQGYRAAHGIDLLGKGCNLYSEVGVSWHNGLRGGQRRQMLASKVLSKYPGALALEEYHV